MLEVLPRGRRRPAVPDASPPLLERREQRSRVVEATAVARLKLCDHGGEDPATCRGLIEAQPRLASRPPQYLDHHRGQEQLWVLGDGRSYGRSQVGATGGWDIDGRNAGIFPFENRAPARLGVAATLHR